MMILVLKHFRPTQNHMPKQLLITSKSCNYYMPMLSYAKARISRNARFFINDL